MPTSHTVTINPTFVFISLSPPQFFNYPPPFYSLLTINPFLLLQPSASHSYALTNCTYLSHCHSPNPLFLVVSFSSSFPLVSLYFSISLKYHYSINPLGAWLRVNICIRPGSNLCLWQMKGPHTHIHASTLRCDLKMIGFIRGNGERKR